MKFKFNLFILLLSFIFSFNAGVDILNNNNVRYGSVDSFDQKFYDDPKNVPNPPDFKTDVYEYYYVYEEITDEPSPLGNKVSKQQQRFPAQKSNSKHRPSVVPPAKSKPLTPIDNQFNVDSAPTLRPPLAPAPQIPQPPAARPPEPQPPSIRPPSALLPFIRNPDQNQFRPMVDAPRFVPPVPVPPTNDVPRFIPPASPPATSSPSINEFNPINFPAPNFGVTRAPVFLGIEKAKQGPPIQTNNFFGSIWTPWSSWSLCQHTIQIRVRACNTLVGFSCFGKNQETQNCVETSDDHPIMLFQPTTVELPATDRPQFQRLLIDRSGGRQAILKLAQEVTDVPIAPPPPPEEGETTLAPTDETDETDAPSPPPETTIQTPVPTSEAPTLQSTFVTQPPLIPSAPPTPILPSTPAPVAFTNAPGPVIVLTFVPLPSPDETVPGQQSTGTGPIPQLPSPQTLGQGNLVWPSDNTVPSFNYIQIQPVLGVTDQVFPTPIPVEAYGNVRQWGQGTEAFDRGSAPINEPARWNNWTPWGVCQCGRQSRTRTCDFNNAALTSGCAGQSYQIVECGSGGCSLAGGNIPVPTNNIPSPIFSGSYSAPSFQPPSGPIPASAYSSNGQIGNVQKPTNYGSPPAPPYPAPPPPRNEYGKVAGYKNSYYPVPTAGPQFFNIWLDGVWQPTAVWQPPAPTVAPQVPGPYGEPPYGGATALTFVTETASLPPAPTFESETASLPTAPVIPEETASLPPAPTFVSEPETPPTPPTEPETPPIPPTEPETPPTPPTEPETPTPLTAQRLALAKNPPAKAKSRNAKPG